MKSRQLHIMWLDDAPEFIDFMQGLLDAKCSSEGQTPYIQIDFQTSIADAFNRLNESDYELLIVDNHMPPEKIFSDIETMGGARTGVFFCEYVRKKMPELPIIMVTGFAGQEFDKKLLDKYSIPIFHKPLQSTAVTNHIHDLINKKDELKKTKLIDALEIKPGAFGVKLDLKEFWRILKKKSEK